MSGIILSVVSRLTHKTAKLRHEILQTFYASCICACFAPFFILKDISDRKKVTKYGITEIELLSGICLLGIIAFIWIERKYIQRFSEVEGR